MIYGCGLRGIPPTPESILGVFFICLEFFFNFDLFLETRMMIPSEELLEISGLRS